MIFVHSFQIKPLLKSKFADINKSLKITLVDYAYSIECIHKFGHQIELYTDILGSHLLGCLPYDKIHVISPPTKNYHFAASIKFGALLKMSLDLILIDGDIFLEKSPVFDIISNLKEDMIVSLYEPQDMIFKSENVIDLFKDNFIPSEDKYPIQDFNDIDGWYNTSLLKFNNLVLKNEYIRQYLSHIKMAEKLEFSGAIWPDIIYEQYNIKSMLNNTKCSINMINPYYAIDSEYCFKIGFCHMGAAKLISHNIYLRRLQILNFETFKIIQNQYNYWINKVIPELLVIDLNN